MHTQRFGDRDVRSRGSLTGRGGETGEPYRDGIAEVGRAPIQLRRLDARVLARFQRSAGNAAVSRMILQRYKGQLGRPGVEVLAADGMIWHGTNVAQFEDRRPGAAAGATISKPSPPAWFSGDPAFSAHASSYLHPSGTAFLKAYTVAADMRLLAFDNLADLNTYLGRGAGGNDDEAAGLVDQQAPGYDGYLLVADARRGQLEYVLFASGLAKLVFSNEVPLTETETRWDQRPGEDRTRKHTMPGGQEFGRLTGQQYSH